MQSFKCNFFYPANSIRWEGSLGSLGASHKIKKEFFSLSLGSVPSWILSRTFLPTFL
jgi:hypothetical protein